MMMQLIERLEANTAFKDSQLSNISVLTRRALHKTTRVEEMPQLLLTTLSIKPQLRLEREWVVKETVEEAQVGGKKLVVAVDNSKVEAVVEVVVVEMTTLLFLAKTTSIPWSCNQKTSG